MIVPLALRLSAARALDGSTIALGAVHDSAIAALDELVQDKPNPFIVVSIDEETYNVNTMDVFQGTRGVDLILDLAVGSAVQLQDGTMGMVIPHTDAGTAFSIDLMKRQVLRVLFEPNSGGAWGVMFRRIAMSVTRIMVRRGAGAKDGVRFAASQLIISMSPIAEPEFGRLPEYLWPDFLALMRGDPKVAGLADTFEKVIIGDPIPEWRQIMSDAGFSDETADGIGILQLGGDDSQPLSAVTIQPDGFVLTAEQGEAQFPAEVWPTSAELLTDDAGLVFEDDAGKDLTDDGGDD